MTLKYPSKTSLPIFGIVLLLLLTSTAAFGDCPVNPSGGDPLQMLVIGDSIMWGQGLLVISKSLSPHYRVADHQHLQRIAA